MHGGGPDLVLVVLDVIIVGEVARHAVQQRPVREGEHRQTLAQDPLTGLPHLREAAHQ